MSRALVGQRGKESRTNLRLGMKEYKYKRDFLLEPNKCSHGYFLDYQMPTFRTSHKLICSIYPLDDI
jgi:hypothetical protein